ncbi:hypothetical protein [Clostridium gasigenes]
MLQDISISLLSLETHLLSEPLREACKKAILVMENAYTEKLIESGFNKEKAEELGIAINLMIESAITVSVGNRDVSALLVVSTQIELLLNN